MRYFEWCNKTSLWLINFNIFVLNQRSVHETAELLQNISSVRIVYASLVEFYSNHIITRVSIQTAGLAFGGTGLCSYRVTDVDGICAKHLTIESYTVFICQQSYLLLLLFHHPHPLSFQTENLPFLQTLPTTAFLFLLQDWLHDSPDIYCYFWAYTFLLFSFYVLHF